MKPKSDIRITQLRFNIDVILCGILIIIKRLRLSLKSDFKIHITLTKNSHRQSYLIFHPSIFATPFQSLLEASGVTGDDVLQKVHTDWQTNFLATLQSETVFMAPLLSSMQPVPVEVMLET